MTALYTLTLVVSIMILRFSIWERKRPMDWLALLIGAVISLLSNPSEELVLTRYLNWSITFSWVPSMQLVGGMAGDPGAGWWRTSSCWGWWWDQTGEQLQWTCWQWFGGQAMSVLWEHSHHQTGPRGWAVQVSLTWHSAYGGQRGSHLVCTSGRRHSQGHTQHGWGRR